MMVPRSKIGTGNDIDRTRSISGAWQTSVKCSITEHISQS